MKHDQQLLLEGNDDCHVVYALCVDFNVPETFEVIDCKGIDKLYKTLPIRLKGSSNLKTVGVVIDADFDPTSRWNTIRNILMTSGKYDNIPATVPADGLILSPIDDEDAKFGLWMMPDNNADGMLENFVTFLIPPDDNLLPIVDETLKHLEDNNLNRYKLIHHEKARIHTWLSWQETPGTPMGLAITKKYLTTRPAICGAFVDWLNRLFKSRD